MKKSKAESETESETENSYENGLKVKATIGPEQRTEKWHGLKRNSIGASEAELAIGGECYGKSRKHLIDRKVAITQPFNTSPAMDFGNKYEVVAKEILTRKFHKCEVVGDCPFIIHEKYPFIGASPDALIIDHKRKKAILSEIKVPYSRVVDGTINPEYMTQLLWQMEVCGIEQNLFCDVSIKEFRTCEKILSLNPKLCGITIKSHKKPHKRAIKTDLPLWWAVFAKNSKKLEKFKKIEKKYKDKESRMKKMDDHRHITQLFYYFGVLDYKLTMIQRDRKWFKKVLPTVKNTWAEIEHRRAHIDEMEEYEIYGIDYLPK